MKKIILLTFIAIALSNCEIKVKESKANITRDDKYNTEDVYIKNMHYKIYTLENEYTSSQTGYFIGIINVTKDSLECEFYKQKLK